MSNDDIQSLLDRANAIIEASPKPSDAKLDLAICLLPDRKSLNARIQTTQWLTGTRRPTDFGVCLRLREWVQRKEQARNRAGKAKKRAKGTTRTKAAGKR